MRVRLFRESIGNLRWWWAKYRLANSNAFTWSGAVTMPANEQFRQAIAAKPRLAPYERLAPLWRLHSQRGSPRYEHFVPAMRRRFRVSLGDVLDLACGVGLFAARLAPDCRRVVGIDSSGLMLAEARKNCGRHANVCIAEGDFRSVVLGEAFDIAVCAFDSINYVDDAEGLRDVLRTAASHLRAGGFFVFDALGEATMRKLARVDSHFLRFGPRHAMCHYFDEATKKSRTLVVFPDGVEEHVRMPIDPPQVAAAAESAGLELLERFRDVRGLRTFYVLRKPREVGRSAGFAT
ncbi:MAG: class I SAM-dependent DNA methyltransferase [Thermoguttaceae bacterium]|jgi:SAM-dependent methyltransferase